MQPSPRKNRSIRVKLPNHAQGTDGKVFRKLASLVAVFLAVFSVFVSADTTDIDKEKTDSLSNQAALSSDDSLVQIAQNDSFLAALSDTDLLIDTSESLSQSDSLDTTLIDSSITDTLSPDTATDTSVVEGALKQFLPDSSEKDTPAVNAASTSESMKEPKEKASVIKRLLIRLKIWGLLRWIYRHVLHFLVLLISGGVIWLTISFYLRNRQSKLFVSHTRLSIMDKEIRKACQYIEDNYDDPDLSIQKICDDLVTGEAFLEALFDRDLGMGVDDFIGQVRVNRAKIILSRTPEISTAELASRVGITKENDFYNLFKSITGNEFSEYRNNLQSIS
ncbi:MAG: helix-turn-helix domain-containing protein [Chitinivibrionales bacterium]|nr:helix-turn-helix domain-containing protein [Chitinivibrionales bacterium]